MNYLERLGIHPTVQSFFKPFISFSGEHLIFKQNEYFEHVGQGFNRIPTTEDIWMAGEPQLASGIVISASAMDAIAWLNLNHARHSLCFIAIGTTPAKYHAETIQKYALHKKLHFIFSNDPSGALCDLKLASFVRNKPLKISYNENLFEVIFEHKTYSFEHLSLNALEKASGYNFRIRTHKPKNASTYYEQLHNRHPA